MNAMIAMQCVGFDAQLALLAIVFVTLAVGTLALSSDLYSRSSQTVSNLRSIGASKGAISSAFALAIVAYGVAGAVVGVAAGSALGFALGSSGAGAISLVVESLGVMVAASTATSAGFYAGARSAWRS